ncbi:MAG: 2-oxoglutarate dehydrogenase, E2 component, dihydrolipoamide succinyltransferase [Propionibacteriaceae bacterium]
MSTTVNLPALGESVTEGTVSRWLKSVGDRIEADEPIVEVSTDKVDTEIPSPVAGILLEIKVNEDDICPVGGVLAIIGDDADVAAPAAPVAAPAPVAPVATEPVAAPAATASATTAAAGTSIVLPQLGESVNEGTVSRWLKSVGDIVEVDEPIVEVSTDKVDTEIPSPVAGTLLEIRFPEDSIAPVGSVLAIVGSPAAATPAAPIAPVAPAAPVTPVAPAAPVAAPVIPTPVAANSEEPRHAANPVEGDDLYVTPLVRKMAAEHGIDLATLAGTGVGGRIRKQDVLAAAEAKKAGAAPAATVPATTAPAAAPVATSTPAVTAPVAKTSAPEDSKRGTTEKISRLRATIAKRMVESLQVSAQLTATVEVDLTTISKLRAKHKNDFKAREGVGLSYLPFITKATIETLKTFPVLNATMDMDAGTITYNDVENIGIAVDTPRGLLVPVVKNAGDLNIAGLAKQIADLAARTRDGKVGPDELAGGTFTITNYGSAGALFDTPIINQPQVAILGTGALVKRPMVINDERLGETIAIRDMMYLSVSYDHRLIDGAVAARFLSAVKARLEEGDFSAEFGA